MYFVLPLLLETEFLSLIIQNGQEVRVIRLPGLAAMQFHNPVTESVGWLLLVEYI
jgi:hypothetical protein